MLQGTVEKVLQECMADFSVEAILDIHRGCGQLLRCLNSLDSQDEAVQLAQKVTSDPVYVGAPLQTDVSHALLQNLLSV